MGSAGGKLCVEPIHGDGLVYLDANWKHVYYQPKQSTEWLQLPPLPFVRDYYCMVTERRKVFLISSDGENFAFDVDASKSEWETIVGIPIPEMKRAFVAASHGKIHILGQHSDMENKDARLLTYDIAKNSWSFILHQAKRPFGFGTIALFLLRGRPLSLLGWFNRSIEVVDESGRFWVSNGRIGNFLRRRKNYLHFDVSTEFFFEKWTIAEYDIERDEVTGRFTCEKYTKLMIAIQDSRFDGRVVNFRVQGTTAVLGIQYHGKELVFKGTLSLTNHMVNWEQLVLPERAPIMIRDATNIVSHSRLSSAPSSFDGGLICQAGWRVYYQSKRGSTLERWLELPKLPVRGRIVYDKKKLFLLEMKGSKEFYVFNMMDLGRKSAAWCRVADMPTSKPNGFQFLNASNSKIYAIPVGSHTMEIYDIKSDTWKVTSYNKSSRRTFILDGKPLLLLYRLSWLEDGYWQAQLLDNDVWVHPTLHIRTGMPLSRHISDVSTKFYSRGLNVYEYDMISDKTKRTFRGITIGKDYNVVVEIFRNGRLYFLGVQDTEALAIFKYEGKTVAFMGHLNAVLEKITWRLVSLPPGAFRVLHTY